MPADKLEATTMELANQLANGPGVALRLDKICAYAGLNMDFGSAVDMLAACQGLAITSQDFQVASRAFQEKREAVFQVR